MASSQYLFGADVFIKTLPEWSHLNLSGGVLIMSQFLFCISSSETVYLTIKALTFSICETSARKLWVFSVRSFFIYFSFSFSSPISFLSLTSFSSFPDSISHPLLFCFLPFLLSSPPFLEAWPPYTLWNTVGPWCIAAARGIEPVAL